MSVLSVCAPAVSGIDWQLARLRELFPELHGAKAAYPEFSERALNAAESILAVPKWHLLSSDYNASVSRVLQVLSSANEGRVNIKCSEQLRHPKHLRKSERSDQAFHRVSAIESGSDFLVFPFQSGWRHRDLSARKVLEKIEADKREWKSLHEFGLGTFEIAIMLLLFPSRLARREDLWIYCAGDEAAHDPGRFSHVPTFSFRDGGLRLSFQGNTGAHPDYGVATGFVPS